MKSVEVVIKFRAVIVSMQPIQLAISGIERRNTIHIGRINLPGIIRRRSVPAANGHLD